MKVIKGNFSDENKKHKNSLEKKNRDIPEITDEDGNYSVMLLDLIKPYMNANPTAEELDEMVDLGITAWNFSIPKSLGIPRNNDRLKSLAAEAGLSKKQVELIKKMEKDKQKKYPGHTSFIKDYELKEDTNNMMKVMVNCIPLMDMMSEGMDFDDEDFDEDDFDEDDLIGNDQYEEGILNRSAFSVNHKSAFIEWANKANNIFKPGKSPIYLIEDQGSEKEANDWLKKNFQKIMRDELAEVIDDKRKWPKLNYKVFCDFFGVTFHEMIWDTEETPLRKY
ncbi:MAG TPA: hypothetical protein VFI29_09005 [Hanamia sp.]|nr:hypothetical protein [Hanamia sp.]